MGISFQAVSNWERGNSMPDISKLSELAEIFGVTLDELLGESSLFAEAVSTELPILKPNQVDTIVANGDVIDNRSFW